MEKSALIDSDVNYDWNFLNYPIHTVSAKPEQTSKEYAILLIHGFGASTDHWRFNIPICNNFLRISWSWNGFISYQST